ncbi:unnamed protein product [Ilex paraguariensis]|uniref:C3H1-type domain-containing protein n=2 Tax=Ilex paraguariensis TaxID=185542 RepID=A0ABC8S305_9AQUA
MDEELQKRNTDCVYFLASPLTCKKGMECEYRHSEMARLNPRDCWYWMSGSCLNPTCAFRHPPLDAGTEASSDAAPPHNQSSVTTSKTKVPCYFYFNGFCNKGDRCSFLHGPEDGAPALIPSKTASAVTDALSMDKKTSAAGDAGSAPLTARPKAYETVLKETAGIQVKAKHDLHQFSPHNLAEQSTAPHVSASACEEAATVRLDTLLPAEGFEQNRSLQCSDQSSEDPVDGHIEREEWLESPPGFDVLVDNGSENLGNEDDTEYLLDGEGRELNGQFVGYDYEDPEYDPACPDVGILYEQEMHSYDLLDDENTYDYGRKSPVHSRETMLDHVSPRKRKFLPMEQSFNGRSGMDLRDHLRKRRVIDVPSGNHFSRRPHSSRLIGRIGDRPRWQGTQRPHSRLASRVENNNTGSHFENEALSNGANQQGRSIHSRINMSGQHFKEKRLGRQQFLSSEVPRKAASKKLRSTEDSTLFTGPKTLAQLKEEKKKTQENGDSFGTTGPSDFTTSEEFQGPKRLSEILKDKSG